MKYLPLVWAALRRKPIRTLVTFLSVTAAFTLFGLMIGLNDTFHKLQERAPANRIWTVGRFGDRALPIAVAHRIARIPGIKRVSVMSYLQGYVGDPKNIAGALMADDVYGDIFTDQLTPEGHVPPNADQSLQDGRDVLQSALHELHEQMQHAPG